MDRKGLIGRPGPERIRVHRVIARLNVGGPAQHVVALTELLDRDLVESHLFAGALDAGEEDLSDLATAAGLTVVPVPGLTPAAGLIGDLRALLWLYRRFRRDRPTIVHTHTAKAGAVGRTAAALARVPVRIHTFHGHVLGGSYFGPRKTTFYRYAERVLARLTHRLVAVSDSQADELARVQAIAPREQFVTVRLGVDLHPFVTVDRREARRRIGLELELRPPDLLIAIVGRVVPIKNHQLLFRSLMHFEDSTLSPRVLVVGGGEARFTAELQALVGRMGLQDRVHWLGWRRDVAELVGAADVLAVPSHDEGTPVAIIEALAAGTPVVARAVGGIPEMLEGNSMCRLARGTRPRDFASELGAVLRVGAVDEDVRSGSRRHAAQTYATGRLAREMEALYLDEVDRVGLGRRPTD